MKKLILSICALLSMQASFAQTKYEKDFNEFWTIVNNNYAYFHEQEIDWNKVKDIYQPEVKHVTNDYEFIHFMENVINEFYNGHISLNTNLDNSNRIIPSGQDMFVESINGKFRITDMRKAYGAELSGLKIGDELLLFNDKPIEPQLAAFLPRHRDLYTSTMYEYALNMLFAGIHKGNRKITVKRAGVQQVFYPDSFPVKQLPGLLEAKILNATTAYIKINNSLGDFDLIPAFDHALDSLIQYKNLVIDLTETPGGGNTTVARAMMGRFINRPMPYQQHEFDEKAYGTRRKWVEYASPHEKRYLGKLYVIVGHWTGSMGEGIALGFDAMERAKIIGTRMAGLLGAVNSFVLSETHIGFQIPTERLYHFNGTPRALYNPNIRTENIEETIKKMQAIK